MWSIFWGENENSEAWQEVEEGTWEDDTVCQIVLTVPKALPVFFQGLAYLHRCGKIHRDVKGRLSAFYLFHFHLCIHIYSRTCALCSVCSLSPVRIMTFCHILFQLEMSSSLKMEQSSWVSFCTLIHAACVLSPMMFLRRIARLHRINWELKALWHLKTCSTQFTVSLLKVSMVHVSVFPYKTPARWHVVSNHALISVVQRLISDGAKIYSHNEPSIWPSLL